MSALLERDIELEDKTKKGMPPWFGRWTSGPGFVAIILVLLIVVFGFLSPKYRFFAIDNLLSIGSNSASILLLSVGLTFVLAAGHIDLSVGMNLVLSSVVSAQVMVALSGTPAQVAAGEYPNQTLAIVAGVVAGILTGGLFGLVNGLIVTKLGVSSFVATLGTMGIATGIFNILNNGSNVNFLPTALQTGFGFARWFGIPAPLLLGLVIAIIGGIVLAYTVFGRQTLAIGSSSSGARRSGVKVDSVTIRIFVIAGTAAGIAGVLDLTKFGTTAISGHGTDVMQALSAVIIGGTSLFGGIATMTGTTISAVLLTVLTAGFVMLGVPPFYQYIAVGVILIGAIWADGLRRRNRDTR